MHFGGWLIKEGTSKDDFVHWIFYGFVWKQALIVGSKLQMQCTMSGNSGGYSHFIELDLGTNLVLASTPTDCFPTENFVGHCSRYFAAHIY